MFINNTSIFEYFSENAKESEFEDVQFEDLVVITANIAYRKTKLTIALLDEEGDIVKFWELLETGEEITVTTHEPSELIWVSTSVRPIMASSFYVPALGASHVVSGSKVTISGRNERHHMRFNSLLEVIGADNYTLKHESTEITENPDTLLVSIVLHGLEHTLTINYDPSIDVNAEAITITWEEADGEL